MKKIILISSSLVFIASIGILAYSLVGQKPSGSDVSPQETAGIIINKVSAETKNTLNAALIGNILNLPENMEGSEKYDTVKKEIDQRLKSIASIKTSSSNPYMYIKNNKDFEYLVQQKDVGLKYLLEKFKESKENGLEQYIMAIACSQILGENPDDKNWDTGRGWYEQYTAKEFIVKSGCLKEIYIMALDSMMPIDEGLNSDMKYIAIDGSKLRYISESEKEQLLKYFGDKYNVKAMDASYDRLKEMGMTKGALGSLEGILLSFSKITVVDKKNVLIEGSKYKSGTGGIGAMSRITYEDGKWKLESTGMTWIS